MFQAKKSKECLLAITGAFDLEGGIAVANRLIIHTLNEAGYLIHLFALNEKPESRGKYASFQNIHYSGLAGSKSKFTFRVWQALIKKRFALVFCDHVNLASIFLPLKYIRRARYVVRLNGIEVFEPLPDFEGRLGLRGASHRLAISEYTRQLVNIRFPRLKIEVCDLALDPFRSKQSERLLPLNPQPISLIAVDGSSRQLRQNVILHVGRMASGEQYKGQDVLIQAMPKILAECPNAQLVLAGKGDDMPRLLNLVRTHLNTIQSAIFMPGYVPENLLEQLYRMCYLFAMPSRGEGFGLVYIEAMSWGKPCLGSRTDAARCIIRDGETGVLVDDPTDPAEVAKQIIRLLKQPELAQAMGLAGYQRVQNYYLFPHFEERFLQALNL